MKLYISCFSSHGIISDFKAGYNVCCMSEMWNAMNYVKVWGSYCICQPTIQSTNQTLFSAQWTRNKAYTSVRIVAIHIRLIIFVKFTFRFRPFMVRCAIVCVLIQVVTMCGSTWTLLCIVNKQFAFILWYSSALVWFGSTRSDITKD